MALLKRYTGNGDEVTNYSTTMPIRLVNGTNVNTTIAQRNNANGTSGGASGGSASYKYSPYNASNDVINAKNAYDTFTANKVADWTGGTYGAALQQAMDRITNREKFNYDLNGDALYQQYKDQYINQGRLAMQDTMGQASAMTGGYGNSYAATAGNQAYQSYLSQLNNVVPELYGLAYDKYNQEGQDLLNQYNMYNNAYNTEYSQYRDQVSDWNTEAQRLSNDWQNAYNMDYGQYMDAQELAYKQAQLNKSSSSGNSSSSSKASTNSTSGTAKANEIKGKKTDNAEAFAKKIEPRNYWLAYIPDSIKSQYGSYDNFVAKRIYDAIQKDEINEEEAKYLMDEVFAISY